MLFSYLFIHLFFRLFIYLFINLFYSFISFDFIITLVKCVLQQYIKINSNQLKKVIYVNKYEKIQPFTLKELLI